MANPDAYTAQEDAVLGVAAAEGVLANDSGDGTLTASPVNGPAHGTLT